VDGFEQLRRPAPRSISVAGVELGRGSRVVLRPGAGADVLDRALAGRLATVESVEQDVDGRLQLAVTVDDDPGRELGRRRMPGHRFFYSPDDVEPLAEPAAQPRRRVLVAGIGNVFMGDDGFGVEVARRLAERTLAAGVEVRDFGIRGLDLVYALGDRHDAVVMVDAVPRGEAPGTLFVIEPEAEAVPVSLDAHGMDPAKVLAVAAQLGAVPERVLLVGCEPLVTVTDDQELVGQLSEPVGAALDDAVRLVESLLDELLEEDEGGGGET
jgi:hydrogenase maturation protease